jgi:hypothetical protein
MQAFKICYPGKKFLMQAIKKKLFIQAHFVDYASNKLFFKKIG